MKFQSPAINNLKPLLQNQNQNFQSPTNYNLKPLLQNQNQNFLPSLSQVTTHHIPSSALSFSSPNLNNHCLLSLLHFSSIDNIVKLSIIVSKFC